MENDRELQVLFESDIAAQRSMVNRLGGMGHVHFERHATGTYKKFRIRALWEIYLMAYNRGVNA